jgi:hypothetical protein
MNGQKTPLPLTDITNNNEIAQFQLAQFAAASPPRRRRHKPSPAPDDGSRTIAYTGTVHQLERRHIMAQFYDSIPDDLIAWMVEQPIFFVGSAPLSAEGHINVSPKGRDSFRVFSPNRVGYLDMTGSGNETSAHLRQNGRITFMFCSFEKTPRILRLYGTGRVVLPSDADWETLSPHFTHLTGTRQIIVADIHKVQTSCGFAVPFMDYVGERDTLEKWWENRGDDGVRDYQAEENQASLDGLPTHLAR